MTITEIKIELNFSLSTDSKLPEVRKVLEELLGIYTNERERIKPFVVDVPFSLTEPEPEFNELYWQFEMIITEINGWFAILNSMTFNQGDKDRIVKWIGILQDDPFKLPRLKQ